MVRLFGIPRTTTRSPQPQRELPESLHRRADRDVTSVDEHRGEVIGSDDPVEILERQNETRAQKLVPVRYGRMLASPFAFLRGSAAVMASDLASTPVTGFYAYACGDMHVSNFGVFGSPERRLMFDVNDFDESRKAPWEWDLKRLVASAVLAGRRLLVCLLLALCL